MLEESRNRYSDLCDFAPLGYFPFDRNGLIFGVNLTGAAGRRRPISLLFIAQLVPEYVKIDRSTLLQAVSSPKVCDFLNDLVLSCTNNHTGMIAEGIETEQELALVRRWGAISAKVFHAAVNRAATDALVQEGGCRRTDHAGKDRDPD